MPKVTQVAKAIPFDNATNGFTSREVQSAIEEVKNSIVSSASPGFSFGRSGSINPGTYLQCESVPSNVSGRWVYITNAYINRIFVSNEDTTTYKIEVLYHDGNEVNLVSLGSVTISAAKGNSFSVNWAVPTGKQLAIRVASDSPSSAKNIVCGLELKGNS